jgi:hypothetical protein
MNCPLTQRCRYFTMKLCPCAMATPPPKRRGGSTKGRTMNMTPYWLKVAERLSPEVER